MISGQVFLLACYDGIGNGIQQRLCPLCYQIVDPIFDIVQLTVDILSMIAKAETAMRANMRRLQFLRGQFIADRQPRDVLLNCGELCRRDNLYPAKFLQFGQREAFLNLSASLGIGDVQTLFLMLIEIDADVLILHLGQRRFHLLGGNISLGSIHDAVADFPKGGLRLIQFEFEGGSKINILDV